MLGWTHYTGWTKRSILAAAAKNAVTTNDNKAAVSDWSVITPLYTCQSY